MVMCAKALLDENPDPDEHAIRHAIRNNICRCTGYAKIVKAIQIASQMMRKAREESLSDDRNWLVGKRVPRVDVRDKVTGSGIYPDDIYLDGMLFAVAVRSKHPRARIDDIDTSLALDVPGVVGVFTADDIPGDVKVGHLKRDWDTMIAVGQVTRYVGDVICLVAAETYKAALKASKLALSLTI